MRNTSKVLAITCLLMAACTVLGIGTAPSAKATVYAPGENAQVWSQLLDKDNLPINNIPSDNVKLTVYYENLDKFLDNVSMTYVSGSDGIYIYNFIAPSTYGSYLSSVVAKWGDNTAYGSGVFQVENWIGPHGPAGENGATWLSGAGAPSGGSNGDFYLDTSNWDVYLKSSGGWNLIGNIQGAAGASGANGAPGENGSVWWYGAGSPSPPSLGRDNDFYLDNVSADIYAKAGGAWSVIGNIKGAAGTGGTPNENGSVWYNGAGGPDPSLGRDNDYYLDNVSADIYERVSGTWVYVTNIMGLPGATGATGAVGPQGFPGENGSVWWNGTGTPDNSFGRDNDYYLENISDNVYNKIGGSWIYTTNIRGMTGENGENGIVGPAGPQSATSSDASLGMVLGLLGGFIGGIVAVFALGLKTEDDEENGG